MSGLDLRITDVTLAHRQEAQAGYSWEAYRAGRKIWGITCVISGSGVWSYADGRRVDISQGQIGFIPASAAYRFFVPEGAKPCLHCTINFLM